MDNITDDKVVTFRHELLVENSLYSSLIGITKEFLISLFQPNFFKYIYVKNSIPSITEHGLDDDHRNTKETPSLTIKLLYDQQESSFDGNSYLGGYMYIPKRAYTSRMYNNLIRDDKNATYISGMPTRQRSNFDIIITAKEEMQAVNIIGSLRRKFPLNQYFILNRKMITVPVPTGIMGYIAKTKGYDLTNNDDFQKFVEFVKEISRGRVQYKVHKATSKRLFFYSYEANLVIKMAGMDSIEGRKENKSVIDTDIRFQLEVEYPTYDYLVTEIFNFKDRDDVVKELGRIDDTGTTIFYHTSVNSVPRELPDGSSGVFYVEFVTDINSEIDEIEFDEFLNLYLKKCLIEMEANNIPYESLLTPKIYRDGKPLDESEFHINWKKRKIEILTPFINYDYKFFVYGKLEELDKLYNIPHDKPYGGNNLIEETL